MKTITRKYKVYSIDELSEDARAKALEKLYDINVDYEDWSECTLDEAKEKLVTMGYSEPKIYFSGFSSQGFECTVDLAQWIKSHDKTYQKKYKFILQYVYDTTEAQDILLNELEEKIIEDARSEADNIYRSLSKEYDNQTSEEAILETIKVNEYTFLEDGSIFN